MPRGRSKGMLLLKHRDSITNNDHWGKRRLVRTNSITSDYARAAGTPLPSKSRGSRVLRSVVEFLSRPKTLKTKFKAAAITEPASPVSVDLCRTDSSASSSRHTVEESSSQVAGQRGMSRPRVSFDAVVTTVIIEQMDEEEVRNTFYCRTEYAAFKEAYRTHRDTSTGWCRSNDVLPCNCDACQDDLVEGGGGDGGQGLPLPPAEDNYDSAFDGPEPPSTPHNIDAAGAALDNEPRGDDKNAPPSPVESRFQDTPQGSDTTAKDSVSPGRSARVRRISSDVAAVPPSTPSSSALGSSSHRRGGSLDDWGVVSSVHEAVRCHGAEYAYKTLRLQGFSDLYIRTHFLPEGSPKGGSR